MSLADYISNNGIITDETHLNFEKKESASSDALRPLIYYYSINGRWEQRELPAEILQMKIGSNPYECEIQLENSEADDVQVLIRHIGEVWYFIESGKNDMMKVNGIKKRQAHLLPESSVIINIGNIQFIFSTRSDKLQLHKNQRLIPQEGAPEKGEFSLNNKGKEVRFPFEKICLIGSNPLCDFYISSKPFCGFITHSNKRLFFTSLILDNEVFVTKNGLNVTENTPLTPGSIIRIDTFDIVLRLSKELRFSQKFNFIPDPKEEHMMLLQIDKKGNPGKAYALPASGSSIFIGRDPEKSRLAISESTKISRKHAQTIVYDKTILLIDNEATNGTFVNNEKIKKRLVHPGDIIRFGNLNFILCFMG